MYNVAIAYQIYHKKIKVRICICAERKQASKHERTLKIEETNETTMQKKKKKYREVILNPKGCKSYVGWNKMKES